MTLFLSCIVVCVIIALCAYYRKRMSKSEALLPPGPRGLPIIGNLHQITKNASVTLSRWAKQYGKLYTIHMGNKPTLVINDAILMRELFGQTAATGRFCSEILNTVFNGPYGIFNTEGKEWHEQRVFFVNALKNAGLGRTTKMESIILEEIESVGDWMENEMRENGKVYLSKALKGVIGDTLWAIMTEERTKTNIASLLETLIVTTEKVTNSGLAFFSWIKDIAPNASGYTKFAKACADIQEFLQENIEDPRRVKGQHQDIIQTYIEHSSKMKDKESSFYGEEGRKHSFHSLLSLLLAGTESTATNMHFLIFYLTAHPDVQTKVQQEIEDIIGEDRDPTVEDQKRMPYLEAVIEESLRMAAGVPLGIMLATTEEISFHEYTLPKGLLLLPNIYHILSDPNVWGDPENFRPERFLEDSAPAEQSTTNRKRVLKDYMVAFQPGKRVCPGEQLARDSLFLFTIKLLRRFTFSPESGKDRLEYMEKRFSYIQMPKSIGVAITARK